MPLPLIPVLIGLGGIVGGIAAWKFFKVKKAIWLEGKVGAGKSSLVNMLIKGEKAIDGKGTVKAVGDAQSLKIKGINALIFDVRGSNSAAKDKEKTRNELAKKYKDNMLLIYVFDASAYNDEVKDYIKAFKKVKENLDYKLVVVGTRKDKIPAEKKEEIENEIKEKIGIQCEIFNLKQACKSELEEFISEIW